MYFIPSTNNDIYGMSVCEMTDFINDCKEKKEKLEEENIQMKSENEKLRNEKNQLLLDIQDLTNQKDKLSSEKDNLTKKIYKISKDIEVIKNKAKEVKNDKLSPIIHKENKVYELHTDLVRDIAKMTTKCEVIDNVIVKNLEIIDFIDDDNIKSTKEMSFYLERNNNKVILRFEEDYNYYIRNEEYLNLNPCLEQKKENLGLTCLLTELRKIGDGRKSGDEFSLFIDPVKAYRYLEKNVFVYINEDFSKQNQDFIDSLIKSGVQRDHICVEPKNSNQLYKIVVNQLLHENDLVVIPSIDILGDDYTDILNFVIDIFYKKANTLVENTLIEYNDFQTSDTISILNKINVLIELKQDKMEKPVVEAKKTKSSDSKKESDKKAKESDSKKESDKKAKESDSKKESDKKVKESDGKKSSGKKAKDSDEDKLSSKEISNVVELDAKKGVSDIDIDDLE